MARLQSSSSQTGGRNLVPGNREKEIQLRAFGRNGRWFVLVALAAFMSVTLVFAACGDDDDDDDGGSAATAAATKSPAAAATTVSPAGGAVTATNIKVTMKDNSFDPKNIEVPTGKEVTFDLKNEGSAIHNMSVKVDGKEIVSEPDTVRAGQSAKLVATFAKAGTYDFKCDFHPTDMTGKITVK